MFLFCHCHSVALWSFCHENKFLVCVNIPGNKAHSDSDSVNMKRVSNRLMSSLKLMAGQSPSGFSDRVQNSWFNQLWQVVQVLKLQSSPRPSHYHHHVWLLVWCSFYEMLCWFYARCNGTHTFQKVQLLLNQSTEYLPKSLGVNHINRDIFGKCETSLCVLLVSSDFCLGTLPWMPFLPSLFLIVESWTLTLIEASEACSSLDVVLGSFMTSWMSRHCALGVILVGWPLLEGSPLFQSEQSTGSFSLKWKRI